MIRAIWFLIQIALIVIAAVWLYERPGSVVVEWMDYRMTVQVGLFLLAVAALVICALVVYRVLSAIASIPKNVAEYGHENQRKRGYRMLTRGLVAVAAGNAKLASEYAHQTRKLLPDEHGLPVLLDAQAARLRGEEAAARRSFQELLEDKDAAFFGIRGLMKSAMDSGNQAQALEYARKALTLHPKQGWILKTVYQLEIQNRLWDDAEKTLKKALKAGAVTKDKATSDEIAMLIIRAEENDETGKAQEAMKKLEKAYKLDAYSLPVVLKLARRYLSKGKRRKATNMIEKIWKENPHPELATLWDQLAPQKKKNDPMHRLAWYEKLVALKPDSAEGQMAAAKAAMEEGLWGEAKAYLTIAEKIRPSARLYRLRAKVEEHSKHSEETVREWLEKAADAPPDKVWTCTQTGHVYERWAPIAQPHGSFNSIVWGIPQLLPQAANDILGGSMNDPLMMIEPAA